MPVSIMRFARVPGYEQPSSAGDDEAWSRYGAQVAAASRQEQLAMSPADARKIVNSFASEAARGNITPNAFATGLFELSGYASSPDLGRRKIRNALKSPIGRMIADNPEIAKDLASSNLDLLRGVGVNPETAGKYLGVGATLLSQAKKDNLLRPDVSLGEVRDKLQKPLYSALQDFAVKNRANPVYKQILKKGMPNQRGYAPDGRSLEGVELHLKEFIPGLAHGPR